MKWNNAVKLLAECEQNLRRLVAEAVGEGDYVSVMRITDWAKAIAALAAEGRSNLGPTSTSTAATRNETLRHSVSPAAQRDNHRARAAPGDYPKFFRRGDELVKVGWSKKDRREYNHRASRGAIDAVAAAVRQLGAKGSMFTGDKLLPLMHADGSRIADYQAYVALAWLKQLGILEQRGRKSGYTLVEGKQIDSTLTAAWPQLDEWRA